MATAQRDIQNTPQQRLSERILDVSDASRLDAGVIAKRMEISASKMTHFRQGARDGLLWIVSFAHAVAGEGLLQNEPWKIVRYVIGEPGAELPLRARLVADEPAVEATLDTERDKAIPGSPNLRVVPTFVEHNPLAIAS